MKRIRINELLVVVLAFSAMACGSGGHPDTSGERVATTVDDHATMDHSAAAHSAAGHESPPPGTHVSHVAPPIKGLWGKVGEAPSTQNHPTPEKLTPLSPDAFDLPSPTSVAEAERARGSASAGHDHAAEGHADESNAAAPHHTATSHADDAQKVAQLFVCPMHPDVISEVAGKCPKCGMALVKKGSE